MFKSERWTPLSGIMSAVIQILAMMISTAITRAKGFQPAFWPSFFLWSMRPRMGVAIVFLAALERLISGDRERYYQNLGYNRTLKDVVMSEILLSALSTPFAVHWLSSKDRARPDCNTPFFKVNVTDINNSLGWIAFAGFASLVCLVVYPCVTCRLHKKEARFSESMARLFLGIEVILMFGSFIAKWVLWSCKSSLPRCSRSSLMSWQHLSMQLGLPIVLVV